MQEIPNRKIMEWSSIIKSKRQNGNNIYIVGDTETTGGITKGTSKTQVYEMEDPKYRGKMHRVLELGFVFCTKDPDTGEFKVIKDTEDKDIYFHKYINPFSEPKDKFNSINSINDIPYGAYKVHGINKSFLNGKESINAGDGKEIKLNGSAPNFQDVINDFLEISTVFENNDNLGNVYTVFHNTKFDLTFMDAEMSLCTNEANQKLPRCQDLFLPYDTLQYFRESLSVEDIKDLKEKSGVTKGKYSLDTLVSIFKNLGYMEKEYDRDLHGAYKDVLITIDVYNAISKYKEDQKQKKDIIVEDKIDFSILNEKNNINKKLKNI